MINDFKKIGDYLLYEKESSKNKIKLQYRFLKNISKIPRHNKEIDFDKAICLNFNLENKTFNFCLSDYSLHIDNRNKFFAHSKKGSGAKIFLNTNSIIPLIESTIPDTLKHCKKLNQDANTKEWYEENIDSEYIILFQKIIDNFFINNEKFVLDPNRITTNQKTKLKKFIPLATDNEGVLNYSDLYKYFINKEYYGSETKSTQKYPNIAQILINNQSILDYDNGKYRESYINLLYHYFIKNHFMKNGIHDKICHICEEKKTVLKSGSPLPMNFYGTTNELYFHNLDNKKSYQSFAICETCTTSAFAGMQYISNFFSDYFIRNSVYFLLIPKIQNEQFFPNLYRSILKILKTNKGAYKNEIAEFREIIQRSNQKKISLDLMFYYEKNNEFNILKYIHNIESDSLLEKLKLFTNTADNYGLDILPWQNNFNLNTIIFSLFAKNQDKNIVYENKKIISFIATFFNSERYNYKYLLTNFNICMKSRIINDLYKWNSLIPLKINLFINIIFKLNMIKGVTTMEHENHVSEVLNEDYRDFFDTHQDIYGNSSIKQGLFLLGTVIANILNVQGKKNKKSTFLKKMNFAGMSVRRLQGFINQVKEYTVIYKKDIYTEQGIWGNIIDRLQGVEESGLSQDEVVFYILSGISFSEYLGVKKGIEKKVDKSTMEEKQHE
ncbi:MAG: TM1802 family CRISPR-associated protein [Atribacterota bacterium]